MNYLAGVINCFMDHPSGSARGASRALALERFGIITIEAMSFGCPVIGTQAGAIPEILEPVAPEPVVPAAPDA